MPAQATRTITTASTTYDGRIARQDKHCRASKRWYDRGIDVDRGVAVVALLLVFIDSGIGGASVASVHGK